MPSVYTIFEGIPMCIRVILKDKIPPLTIKFRKLFSRGDIKILASYKHTDPTVKNADFVINDLSTLKIKDQFKGENLFLLLISNIGCSIEVLARFVETNLP